MAVRDILGRRDIRKVVLFVALLSLIACVSSVAYLPHETWLALSFGGISLVSCVLLFFGPRSKDDDAESQSLRRLTKWYGAFLVFWMIVGAIGFSIEYNVTEPFDLLAVAMFAILSVSVWGGVAFVVIVVPIWFLYGLIRSDEN